jgi:hypothetical protein
VEAPKKRGTPPHNRIHRTLDRALAAAQLGPHEAILIQHARELSYAKGLAIESPDPLPFTLDIQAIARTFDCRTRALQLARQRLLAANLIRTTESGYLIQKDYRQWREPFALNEQQIRYADNGKTWSPFPNDKTPTRKW